MNKLAPPIASLFLITAVSSAQAAACGPANSIVSVQNTSAGRFEYVVFTFHKPPMTPQYTVAAASPPFIEDSGGTRIAVAGAKFTKVQFTSVYWLCSIKQTFHLPRRAIKDVKSIGQFEGVVTYIIGRGARSRYVTNYSYDLSASARAIVVKYLRPGRWL